MTDFQSDNERHRIMRGVLAWEGEISNARVRHLFDVQIIQASRLLKEFREAMGDAVVVAGRTKAVRPVMPGKIETDMALDEYIALTGRAPGNAEILVDARVDLTDIEPRVFATLRQAALTRSGVEITYSSMKNPIAKARIVFPHAIVQVGRRWHVRAWCKNRNEFRDFNLGRIRDATARPELPAPFGAGDDHDWNEKVVVRLAAHRGLSQDQQKVVREEFFGGTMGRRLTLRLALARYVIQDIRAALDPDKEIPPEFQLEVVNPHDLQKWS